MDALDPRYLTLAGPAIAAAVGLISAVIGLGSGLFIAHRQWQAKIAEKIVETYFEARQEICELLSKVAYLGIADPITEGEIDESKRELSRLFFKYYDVLPISILLELECLFTCLTDRDHRLFGHKDRTIVALSREETS